MPRISRSSYETEFFHVIVQGINKEHIFKENYMKRKYFEFLKKYYDNFKIKIIAYVIMGNHAHLLIYSSDVKDMSEFMKRVNISYARYYNSLKNRTGYVFRDRYVSEPILSEKYLQNCICYIHKNPVKAGIVNHCSKYKFSSYNDYLNKANFIDENCLNLVLGTAKDYIEQYIYIHKGEHEFKDYIEYKEIDICKIIKDYLEINNHKSLDDIIQNKDYLKDFVMLLREKYSISSRKISKIIDVDCNRINRLIK